VCGSSNNSTVSTSTDSITLKQVVAVLATVVIEAVVVPVVVLGVIVVPQVQGSCRRQHVQLTEPAQTTPELVPAGYVMCLLWTRSPTQYHEPVSMPRQATRQCSYTAISILAHEMIK